MKDDLTEPTLTPSRRQFLQLGAMVTAAFKLDQSALADAVQNHYSKAITSARHALAKALKRVRNLKSWRALAELGKGRPLTSRDAK